jgi:hypothetical protein
MVKRLESTKEIFPYLKKAKDDRDALNAELATASPKNRAAIQTKYNTAKDQVDIYQKMYDDAKDREDAASKAISSKVEGQKTKQSGAQTRIKSLEDTVIASGKRFRGDPNDENKYNTYQNDMAVLAKQYDSFDSQGFVFPRIVSSVEGGYSETTFAPTETATTPTTMAGAEALAGEKQTLTGVQDPATTVKSKVTVVENGNNVEVTTYMDGRVSKKVLGKSNLPDTASSAIPKGTAGTPTAMKTYVDQQLIAKGLPDTPANRKTLRAEYQALPQAEKGKAAAPAATDNSWEQLFIKNNPAKAWYLTDLDRNKYPQLFAILKEYALPRPLTVEEQSAFAAKLDGTDFFRELSTSGKVREIKNVVGELGFDSTDFTQFVHTAINMGYTGDRLKQETYKEVFKTGADGKYVNPTALARATKSADYLNVVNDARAYFNTAGADQASVQSILTGGITREDFQRQQREIAKKRYPHLADLIDQGVSLESLAGNFKNTAAELLEVDPNTLDMSAADYEVAINFGEEGKKRVMSTGEWDRLLRTDPKYKWEYTNNAKDEARGLAANLVKAFGRII